MLVGGLLLNPDVSCQYSETAMALDTEPLTQLRITALYGTVPKCLAADSSSCSINTDADDTAVPLNSKNENTDKRRPR